MCSMNLEAQNAALEVEKEGRIWILSLSPLQHPTCLIHTCNQQSWSLRHWAYDRPASILVLGLTIAVLVLTFWFCFQR